MQEASLRAQIKVNHGRDRFLGQFAKDDILVVFHGEQRRARKSFRSQQGLHIVDGPRVAVGVNNSVERFRRFVRARMLAFFIPRKTAIVAPDAEFPDDEPGLVFEMLHNAGHGLSAAVHAFGTKRIRRAGEIIIDIFMP